MQVYFMIANERPEVTIYNSFHRNLLYEYIVIIVNSYARVYNQKMFTSKCRIITRGSKTVKQHKWLYNVQYVGAIYFVSSLIWKNEPRFYITLGLNALESVKLSQRKGNHNKSFIILARDNSCWEDA